MKGLPEPEPDFKIPDLLPALPLKETVIFPFAIVPISVEPERGVLAVDQALGGNRLILLVAQREAGTTVQSIDDVYRVGTVGVIMRMLKLPDGRLRILVQGLTRARILGFGQVQPFLRARVERLEAPAERPSEPADPAQEALRDEALMRSVRDSLEKAMQLGKGLSPEVVMLAANLDDMGRLADLTAANLELPLAKAQELLEEKTPYGRLQRVNELLLRELDLLLMQQQISTQAQGEIDRNQREYYLRQQLKAIQQELSGSDELAEEIATYRKLARERGMSEEATVELEKQISRLERSNPESGENTILRTYLDWLTGLPWNLRSEDHLDLAHARQILDEDHYGLEKVKERIIEFLAVRKLKADSKGPIICFVGPPGVGKTSLGRSIARALGRKFVRLSLGGVRDEAEVRGHRRTYVGAMPGRIIQGLHQARTGNPVFMLDEIDKIGADHRGDPSSALLEVLDPEQNSTFRDNYLGVPYDLSEVIFITTANLLEPIQAAFLDRMEIIHLSGYTEEEKREIAERHLIPKQLRENGILAEQLAFSPQGIRALIRGYTREAGLRHLEREIAAICRKTAVKVASGQLEKPQLVQPSSLARFLGPEKNFNDALLDRHRVGVATGLAWTATGGDLLLIEAVAVPGQGKLVLTGSLGDVMKESAQAALTFARHHAARALGGLVETIPEVGVDQDALERSTPERATRESVSRDFFARHDIHIHAPAGSIPKDGPSAGITMTTAIISVVTGRPIYRDLAMTGEITLRGDILPIGGLKEKALAARAAGIRKVIIPKLNEREIGQLPKVLRRELTFFCFSHMDQVLELALVP